MVRTLTVFLIVAVFVIPGDRGQVDTVASQQFGEAPDHPLVGSWMLSQPPDIADAPWILAPAQFRADRTVVLIVPPRHGRNGDLISATMAIGTWRPTGPQEARFTAIHSAFDANGAFHGTVTIEGFPVVSASGQTFTDTGTDSMITEKDAAGFVVPTPGQADSRSPMMATRIVPGSNPVQNPCGPLLPFCE